MSRSEVMRRIGPKNTKPELIIRQALHAEGFRFRLHRADLPGKPDLVLAKHRAAIFVHGCFWHAHQGCRYFQVPKTRVEFWEAKLQANAERDYLVRESLLERGWRVLTIWECATRNAPRSLLVKRISEWLLTKEPSGEIAERDILGG